MADDKAVEVPVAVKTSDLPKRVASAVVMLAVAGAAFWIGGAVLAGFIWLVALVGFGECVLLVPKATSNLAWRIVGIVAAAAYFGLAAWVMASLDTYYLVAAIGVVIFTDTGAYFTGRAIGGPKIAPKISPSKTWAGLFGGMAFAALWLAIVAGMFFYTAGYRTWSELIDIAWDDVTGAALVGALLAVVAQAGDFFQSWLKRKAGVKDSSRLIPGHGGVFDRIDGMLAVALVVGVLEGFA
ncbi:MAG: phosphatidate cytidylyltransferase [Porphyrobacter sp.]|nr:phosphatidate cytidylyltransferase [Porphyrobacter sp.]